MAKPIYDIVEAACEVCEGWEFAHETVEAPHVRRCTNCANAIPLYENMAGQGFRSREPHHFHTNRVDNKTAIYGELCAECFEFVPEFNPLETAPV